MGDYSPMNVVPPVYPSPSARSVPFREDCWSEEATGTLVDAWGRRYMELHRGNLRQKDWQEVAGAVNALHGHTKKQRRTDVQCKNRIDTIKKKYKIEKARVCDSNGTFVSSWPFFDQLDVLIGVKRDVFTRRAAAGAGAGAGGSGSGSGMVRAEGFSRNGTPPMAIVLHQEAERKELPVAVVMPQKRSAPVDDSYFRRNYSAMAAAAAKVEVEDDEETEDELSDESDEETAEERGVDRKLGDGKLGESDGMKMLARAIESFAVSYERVEKEKLIQMKELEMKRIEMGREAEIQRTQMLCDMQVQIERLKQDRKKSSKSPKSPGLDKLSGVDKSSGLDDL